jgi:PhzF family phenazine biosynthesis protein
MMRIYQVDSFTSEPFKGNPAAVCILSKEKDEDWMHLVAREMNLSETAFLIPQGQKFKLRWFTPTAEVDLCGHATLASAHILWERGYLKKEEKAEFITKSGHLAAYYRDDWIELDFPAEPQHSTDIPGDIIDGLGIKKAIYTGKNRLDYLIEVESEDILKSLLPNFSLLGKILDYRGVMVTCRAESDKYDFISRYFAPGVGIDEDPVTGSAHCCLGPYWQEKLNKNEFMAFQASNRGGVLKVKVRKDRVLLIGKAVTVLVGDLID